jgi:hypothetical protein
VIAVLLLPSIARADAEEAKRLGEVAANHAKAKRYSEAARSYRAAFRAQPLPEYLCNVGVAYFKDGDLPRAQRYLGECLVTGASLDGSFLARVRKVLDEVETKLAGGAYAAIDVAVEPPSTTITLAGDVYDEPFVGSRRIWVPRGTHQISLHAEGHVDETLDVDATKAAVRVRKALRVETLATVAPPPPTPALKPIAETRPRARRSKAVPVTVTILTGVTALGALGLYAYARRVANDAEQAPDQATYDDRVDTARTFQHASWITAGVAGIGAVASVYLWMRASGDDRSVAVVPSHAGAAGVTLTVTYRAGF